MSLYAASIVPVVIADALAVVLRGWSSEGKVEDVVPGVLDG